MNQTNTAKSLMFAIVAMGIVFSVCGLVAGQTIATAYATHPGHHRNSGDGDAGSGSGNTGSGSDTASALQLTTAQAPSSNAACGQVVSGVVNLTANLNCEWRWYHSRWSKHSN